MRKAAGVVHMLLALGVVGSLSAQDLDVHAPQVFLTGIPFTVSVEAPSSLDTLEITLLDGAGRPVASDFLLPLGQVRFADLSVRSRADLPLRIAVDGEARVVLERPVLPGWTSILPPLVAILLAIITHEVVTSLFVGVWTAAFLLGGFNPIAALLRTVDTYVRPALADGDHAAIIVFSLLLGGMVGVLTKMGATRAIVDALAPVATTKRRGQLATWLAGLAIFFDDYANTLIVGNTMRPLTDRLRISREKLAYIVDSTAAPVTAVVFVSTWVGVELSLIGDGLVLAAAQSGTDPATAEALRAASPFAVFLNSIPYLFYPLFAVALVFLVASMNRDFGPMLSAERRAASGEGLHRPGAQLLADTDGLVADEEVRAGWWAAVIPVVGVVGTVMAGLIWTGLQALPEDTVPSLSNILRGADPFVPLLWGSLVGSVLAIGFATLGRSLNLSNAIGAWVTGIKSMTLAIVILTLAWSLGAATQAMETASFLASALSARLPVEFLPLVVFGIAAATSFATGTAWGTMGILFPLVIPLAITLSGGVVPGEVAQYSILLGSSASVMAGALFGDHCSPISDTTVMSSMASACDHVDHVRTQMPYALFAATVAVLAGYLPEAYGIPVWASLAAGMVLMVLVVRLVGRRVA